MVIIMLTILIKAMIKTIPIIIIILTMIMKTISIIIIQ